MNNWSWLIFTIIVSVLYLLLFKRLSQYNQWYLLIPISILGLLSLYGYYKLFKQNGLGITYAILTGSIIVLIALLSSLFYHEHLTLINYLGIASIVLGIILLNL